MTLAKGTAAIAGPVASKPSRWKRVRESLGILVRSKTALVGAVLIGFWLLVALFADNCLVSPACWVQTACQGTPPGASLSAGEGGGNGGSPLASLQQGVCLPLQSITGAGDFEPTPWLSRYDYREQFRGEYREGPSAKHWLGTDSRGRDIWARLAYGSRPILTLAPLSVFIALAIGGTLGLVAGYYGGFIDEVMMRVLDAMISFPQVLLYLVIIAALGPSAFNVVLAIVIAGVPGIARLVRGLTLDVKTRDYIAAAQTRGESPWYIMFVEILPNARGPIIIDAMLRMGYAVFAIGTLGFLGLGLPPPSPDWGSIVNAGKKLILQGHPWEALFGSMAIAMVVVGLNLIADGLSEEGRRYQ
ncbi:MAG: ABC transporter permease [Chloroflexaceae bacterium]|nr:ABC transporter permease [Chloroflexaceae bacterium]